MLAPLLSIYLAVTSPEPMPEWVLRGILFTETRSWYNDDGSIHYTDKRRGKDGEISAFQITRHAFNQVRTRGESFWPAETDQRFAKQMVIRSLRWLYRREPNWNKVVESYNAGPFRRPPAYLQRVKAAGL